MTLSKRLALISFIPIAAIVTGLFCATANPLRAEEPGAAQGGTQQGNNPSDPDSVCDTSSLDSPYIPVDSWVYPAVWRLYALGFIDTVYLGMRPYTRSSLDHMLEEADARLEDVDSGPAADEARSIYEALNHELHFDVQGPCGSHKGKARIESIYSVERAISGTPLRDSFHLGSTVINDYGRPYQNGFNDYTGASGYASAGHFQIYARGEFQGAPSGAGYSTALAQTLATIDGTTDFFNPTCWQYQTSCTPIPLNQLSTIPVGPIASTTTGRIMEAYASANYLNHEISFGKQDNWLSPAQGGAMAYSNNAENIYSFRINRVEPLRIPLISTLFGPFRYDFMVGSLKGHVYPNDPWVHVEKVSLRPTKDLEFGFERTVIWGGKNHEPINLHSFLRSFFSFSAPQGNVKDSTSDPGARFGAFDFSYRLPWISNWLTLYADSEVHDDISPIDAPRRAAYRPGLYLSHVPGIPKLDMRAEAASTDPAASGGPGGGSSSEGQFMYWEAIQRQGYTNKGVLFGDWIGRQDKGGQAWITYHLSGNEWLQVGLRRQKAGKDFIEIPAIPATATTPYIPAVEYGTTLTDINFQAVKRIGKDLEINGKFAYEKWKTPLYGPSQQNVTTTTIQLTWFPKNKLSF
jgi:hypothetical protein